MRIIGIGCTMFILAAVGCSKDDGGANGGAGQSQNLESLGDCGGFSGADCSEGLVCIDDPSDDCDPSTGGADCPGRCIELPDPLVTCGGFGNFPCPGRLTCIDDPRDDCGPPQGSDCGGICVSL